MAVMAFLYFATVMASGYVSNADVSDENKTNFNVAVIVIWVVLIILACLFWK